MKKLLLTALVAALTFSPVLAAEPTPAPSPSPTPAAQEAGFWLTEKGGKRHNSKCRYYQKTKGKPCEATEGIACKVCGG